MFSEMQNITAEIVIALRKEPIVELIAQFLQILPKSNLLKEGNGLVLGHKINQTN